MSLFPRFTQEVSPLFRLLDDYDRQTFRSLNKKVQSFSPKFDVQELKDSYELHGEFPGIEQKNINIEWTDGNTLTISGRHETVKEEGQRPQGFIEAGEAKDDKEEHYQKPTVEDEGETSTQVAQKPQQEVSKEAQEPETKYWVSERSVGEFHRSFSFPARIDQDNVKASLKNGILSIVVPKAKAPQPRKINIE